MKAWEGNLECAWKRGYTPPLQELGGDWKRTTSAQVNGILRELPISQPLSVYREAISDH